MLFRWVHDTAGIIVRLVTGARQLAPCHLRQGWTVPSSFARVDNWYHLVCQGVQLVPSSFAKVDNWHPDKTRWYQLFTQSKIVGYQLSTPVKNGMVQVVHPCQTWYGTSCPPLTKNGMVPVVHPVKNGMVTVVHPCQKGNGTNCPPPGKRRLIKQAQF